MTPIDFNGLNARLSLRIRELLPSWLPGGKIVGKEYMVASLLGGTGDSLRFNIEKCIGSDFSTDDKFGDCIDLYAKINNLTQIESAKQLNEQYPTSLPKIKTEEKPVIVLPKIILPPENAPKCNFNHYKYGEPSAIYPYRNENADLIYYMCRYETPTGKQFFPFSFFNDNTWKMKAQEIPRPLFILDEVSTTDLPILIVEGEKAALAAQKFVSEVYTVTTWSNGSQSFSKSNWKPLYGKSILLWPDGDESGIKAMNQIAKILSPHCPEIKIIEVSSDDNGADAADYEFTWNEFKSWAKPKIKLYSHVQEPELLNSKKNSDPNELVIDGSIYSIWEKIGVAQTASGQAVCNLDNVLRVLEGFPLFTNILWFDEFHQKYYTLWQSSTPREWSDIDDFRLTSFLQRSLGFKSISDNDVNKAIRLHGKNNTKNEPKDWLNSLIWDNESRISDFFKNAAGALENEYVQSASQNFWLTMVARILRPGCQVDNMIVLEGNQGKGKTSLLRAIGQNWYSSVKEKVDSNNFFQIMEGKLLLEIAELDSFNRAEITRIKQVVSDPIDRYRTPYDKKPEDHPRQSIFVGTTNEYAYLRDDTGGRRFWPVKCGSIDLIYAQTYRDQLFAEAVNLFKSGATWWLMPESTQDEQEQRRQIDPWEDLILDFAMQKFEVTTLEIMNSCLHIEKSKQSRFDEMRIGKILLKLKWNRTRKRLNGDLRWIYTKDEQKPYENIK